MVCPWIMKRMAKIRARSIATIRPDCEGLELIYANQYS